MCKNERLALGEYCSRQESHDGKNWRCKRTFVCWWRLGVRFEIETAENNRGKSGKINRFKAVLRA